MDARTTEFLSLIDRALVAAGADASQGAKVSAALQSLRGQIEAGSLEPSRGVVTLGLARHVADSAGSLASPLLQAVGELERFYQERYRE
jgi:hypothetical protein